MKRNIIFSLVFLLIASELVVAEAVNRRVVGLVELPSVFGKFDPNGPPGLVPPANVQAVQIYSHPSRNSPVVGKISGLESVETKEFDYEAPAAVVYKIVDGWVLIHITDSLKNGFGWVSPHERGSFHPLVDLLNSGLCYLEEDWDGVLYESTNTLKGIKRIRVDGERRDINIVRSKEHQGVLWLEVELLGPGRCKGENPEVLVKGWIPAHKKDGKTNIW
ncbi:hypothetical protein ACFL3R_01575, partial [Thermodesulfobacteriota bacterium]